MTTAALVGSTGLVGSQILKELLVNSSISSVYAYSRRELPNPTASTKLNPVTSTDTSAWPSLYPREMNIKVFFSALGTTRAAAGGVDAQRKVDVDLNYDLAKAAKDAGADTYVLISSGGANSKSMAAYTKMKGEIEDKVTELGFKHTVILRPGLLLGDRQESRPAESVFRGVAGMLKKVSPGLVNFWAQDVSTIAKVAVLAAVQCAEGKKGEGVWEIGQADIVRMGKEGK